MTERDVCEVKSVNKKAVEEVKSKMLEDITVLRVAEIFKILADSTRVKILYALSRRELCVCDLAALLGMTHSAVSHQLRLLRNFNLVKYRRGGKNVYYSLADEHVIRLIDMGFSTRKKGR